MKYEDIYASLKVILETAHIKVIEKNLHLPGLRAKSGLCIVEGEKRFLLDKHIKLKEKADMLATCISLTAIDLETIYVVPVVREHIETAGQRYLKRKTKSMVNYSFDDETPEG